MAMNRFIVGVLLLTSISLSQKALANRESPPMSVYSSVEVDPFITYEEVKERINKVAKQLALDYKSQEIVIVMIMKGALCLAVDLIRAISFPCTIEYMQTSSYGMKGECRGGLEIKGVEALDLESKNVLLVDDIFDSGNTLSQVHQALAKKNPKSLKSLVLVSRNVSRDIDYRPDYVLFNIEEDGFIVGCGFDYKEHYRGLKDVYLLKDLEAISDF
ncbi:MAG: hypoxanthine phosphoribosyltransferase [Chlamydiae bacterium]|nr:MAG: hypoxanthine phosphoribosyltransferase [Chlamydiota bacterium]